MWRRLSISIACLLLPFSLAACIYRLSQPVKESFPSSPEPSLSFPTPFAATPPIPTTPSVAPPMTPEAAKPALTQYLLNAVLDYSQHHLEVEQHITYTNQTGVALDEISLAIEPNRYIGVFKLNNLKLGETQAIANFTLENNELRIPLPQTLADGKRLALSLSYELFLPSPIPNPYTRPVPFGYTSRQTNLVDWYPYIPPYTHSQGWLLHKPGYFGEHQVYEISNYQVNIQIKDLPSPHSDSSSPRITLAASSPGLVEGEWMHFQSENARNFSWSVSHEYLLKSKIVGDFTINSYYFPYHDKAGEAALDTTVKALELYTKLFAPYPHNTLSVVEADFLDGMEFDGLYFLSNGFYNLYGGAPGEYLVDIAAHETAHQWWYALVDHLDCPCYTLSELKAETLYQAVREEMSA